MEIVVSVYFKLFEKNVLNMIIINGVTGVNKDTQCTVTPVTLRVLRLIKTDFSQLINYQTILSIHHTNCAIKLKEKYKDYSDILIGIAFTKL